MRVQFYHWLKVNSVMFINAASLVGSTLTTSALGFGYWWLAARLFSAESVGLASAIISAMMLLGTLGILGLNTLLVGELSRQPGSELSLISAALVLVGGVAGCLGILFALTAHFLTSDFQLLGASVVNVVLFAAGVSLTAITLVLDQALMGLLRGQQQFWRNTVFAAIKLIALLLCGLYLQHTTGLTIYTTWTTGNILSLAVLAWFALRKNRETRNSYRPQWQLLHKLGFTAIKHHALNLTLLAPAQILPIIVTIMLTATANAWFYVSLSITNLIGMLPIALTTVLYAESSARPDRLTYKMRVTLPLSFLLCGLAISLLWLLGEQLLSLFGTSYAEGALLSLRILSFEALPVTIRLHYVTIFRIQGQIGRATLPFIAIGIFQLVGAVIGAHLAGLAGLSFGWLITDCIGALFLLPPVYRIIFPPAKPVEKLLSRLPFLNTKIQEKGLTNE